MVYLIAVSLSLFLSRIITVSKRASFLKKAFSIFLIALPLIIVSSLRLDIGTDYPNYEKIFDFIKTYKLNLFDYDIEPGYALLNIAVNSVFHDFRWLIIVTSFFYVFFVFWFIYKESVDVGFSIFLFIALTFYFSSFNTVREHLGISILLLSFPFIQKRKFFPFALLVFIAGMFHYSCFVFLIAFFLYPFKITPKVAVILILTFLVLSVPISVLFTRFISATPYSKYLDGESGFTLASALGILVQLSIFVFASVFYKKDQKYSFYYSLQAISLLICVFGGVIPLISRIKWIFFMPSIILIPLSLKNIKSYNDRLITKMIASLLFVVYAFVVVFVKHSYEVYPYKSLFDAEGLSLWI